MKANELMIGDWVQGSPCGQHCDRNNKTYYKIALLDIGNNCWGYSVCGALVELKYDDIFPIPLTPEILEKNGFKKVQIHGEKQDDIFQCFDGEIIIEVGIYNPNFILIHYRYEIPDGINSGELSSIVKVDGGKFYLHELQHALRLCGISKEIEL